MAVFTPINYSIRYLGTVLTRMIYMMQWKALRTRKPFSMSRETYLVLFLVLLFFS